MVITFIRIEISYKYLIKDFISKHIIRIASILHQYRKFAILTRAYQIFLAKKHVLKT